MPLTLNDLPDEVLFLVLELGALNTKDGLSIRWTSRRLHAATETLSFWLCFASSLEQPSLPVHLFSKLETMTAEGLRDACIRHYRTCRNLASTSPKYHQKRVLDVPSGDKTASITCVRMLPGGHHAFVFCSHGSIHLWALGSSEDGSEDKPHPSRILASFGAGQIVGYDYQLSHYTDLDEIRFGIISTRLNSDDSSTSRLDIVAFVFTSHDPEKVVVQQISSHEPMGGSSYYQRVSLSQNLAIVVCQTTDEPIAVLVTDHRRQGTITFSTTIEHPRTTYFDTALSNDEDLLLCSSGATEVIIHAYYGIDKLLDERLGAPGPISIPPHASQTISYHPDCQYPSDRNWFTWIRKNTSTRKQQRLVITTFSDPPEATEPSIGSRYTAQRYLDIRDLFADIKSSNTKLGLRRSSFPESAEKSSAKGCHLLWHHRPGTGAPRLNILRLIPLDGFPADPTPELTPRELDIPMDLTIATAVDFCDETSILSIVTEDSTTASQTISLFSY